MKIKKIPWIVFFLIITGCSFINPIESDWTSAKNSNTRRAFEQYLSQYPSGPHSDEARSILEDLYYQDVRKNKMHPNHYLTKFPDGKHADEMGFLLAKSLNTLFDYNDFLEKHPGGPFAKKARGIVQSIESQFKPIDSKKKKHPDSTAIIEDWRGNIIEVIGDITFENVCLNEIQFSDRHMWKTKPLYKLPGVGISTQRWGLTSISDKNDSFLSAIDIYLPPEAVFKYNLSVVDRVMYFRKKNKVAYYKLMDADSQRYIKGKSTTGDFKIDLYTLKRFQKFDDQPAIDFSILDSGQVNSEDHHKKVILTTKRLGTLSLGKVYLRVSLCTKPGYRYNSNFCRQTYTFETIPLKLSDKRETDHLKLSEIHSIYPLVDYSGKKQLEITTTKGVRLTGTLDNESLRVPMDTVLETICSEGILGESLNGSYLFIPFSEIEKLETLWK